MNISGPGSPKAVYYEQPAGFDLSKIIYVFRKPFSVEQVFKLGYRDIGLSSLIHVIERTVLYIAQTCIAGNIQDSTGGCRDRTYRASAAA